MDALAGWVNGTSTDKAMTDVYDTVGGTYPVDDGVDRSSLWRDMCRGFV